MEKILKIDDLRALLEDGERLILAYSSREHIFPWIDPKNIAVVDIELDSEIMIEYFSECLDQRNALLEPLSEIEKITPLMHLEALLYLALEYGVEISFAEVRRELMTEVDFVEALSMIENTIREAGFNEIKDHLREFAYHVFCYVYISPELENYPVIRELLANPEFCSRLDKLDRRV